MQKNSVEEVSAVHFSILITTFIISLPDAQCSHVFFSLSKLITLPPIIQMFCLCNFFLPVDFLLMRIIGQASIFLALYCVLAHILFKIRLEFSVYHFLLSLCPVRLFLQKKVSGCFHGF